MSGEPKEDAKNLLDKGFSVSNATRLLMSMYPGLSRKDASGLIGEAAKAKQDDKVAA
ncbi:MAG: hypothetical protein GWN93_05905 [Deltaproteobacteria bacterium]|nr:hypothetical protein [Deltaproteobacteria bacterium]